MYDFSLLQRNLCQNNVGVLDPQPTELATTIWFWSWVEMRWSQHPREDWWFIDDTTYGIAIHAPHSTVPVDSGMAFQLKVTCLVLSSFLLLCMLDFASVGVWCLSAGCLTCLSGWVCFFSAYDIYPDYPFSFWCFCLPVRWVVALFEIDFLCILLLSIYYKLYRWLTFSAVGNFNYLDWLALYYLQGWLGAV
jgi:hypothetical protein